MHIVEPIYLFLTSKKLKKKSLFKSQKKSKQYDIKVLVLST